MEHAATWMQMSPKCHTVPNRFGGASAQVHQPVRLITGSGHRETTVRVGRPMSPPFSTYHSRPSPRRGVSRPTSLFTLQVQAHKR